MATSLPISPKVATPLGHRKRRYSALSPGAVIDLTGSEDEAKVATPRYVSKAVPSTVDKSSQSSVATNANVQEKARRLEDDTRGDSEDDDLMEDMLDTFEVEPFRPDDGEVGFFDKRDRARILARLRSDGPEKFLREILDEAKALPTNLGIVFGINPEIWDEYGGAFFMRLLGQAVLRAYNKRLKLTKYNTIDDAATLVRERKNIMVITGAGISTSLGIPDFRSKHTGFYTKLLQRGIEEPEQVFDIHEFDYDPSTFYELAADILPDLQRYSPTHAFIRLLQDKGKLQTNYTQNIDNLEELAGIDKQRLIQCHGSFATATCRKCRYKVKGTEIFPDIRAKRVARCKRCAATIASEAAKPKLKRHKSSRYDDDDGEDDNIPEPGVMKPDITFFGEQLPDDFFDRFKDYDSRSVDLVIVIGTSLKVAPVSEMPNCLPHDVPHIYISREPVEHVNFDVQLLGNCDDVVVELCRRAGWKLEHEMVPKGGKVSVEAVEGTVYRWRVRKVDGKSEVNGGGGAKAINGHA